LAALRDQHAAAEARRTELQKQLDGITENLKF
jgi:hypothetical protein